ncbi:unnamed protein product [Lampetra planeri]
MSRSESETLGPGALCVRHVITPPESDVLSPDTASGGPIAESAGGVGNGGAVPGPCARGQRRPRRQKPSPRIGFPRRYRSLACLR